MTQQQNPTDNESRIRKAFDVAFELANKCPAEVWHVTFSAIFNAMSINSDSLGPVRREYYKPLESPRMYPLELDERLHVNLWSEDGQYKWTIAMWVDDGECSELRFLHNRPFDPRVNWRDLEAIARQGQVLADKRYEEKLTSLSQRTR